MISSTKREHSASRENTKEWEHELQRSAPQRRESTLCQPHGGHVLAGDGHHPLCKERPRTKTRERLSERGCATDERPVPAGQLAVRRDDDTLSLPSTPTDTPDGNLFSMLMGHDTPFLSCPPMDTPESVGSGMPMARWQPLENELERLLNNHPTGPVSVTLLLPRLGDVDARLQALPSGGWDIALRFAPAALDALAAYEERCSHSLRRRLACRVRLRFEQRKAPE